MGLLATLFVDIGARTGGFDSGINRVHSLCERAKTQLSETALAAKGLFVGLAAGATAAATAGLVSAVHRASDLAESLDKVKVVFGSTAIQVTRFADEMAVKFGTVKAVSLDAVAQIGLIGKAAGLSQAKAAALGIEFAKLAADLSSLNNSTFEEALQKVRSGLVGEAEPLRVWGVLLSEDAVQAEALAMGLAKSAKEAKHLTDAQKVMARASLIKKQTGDAHGNLELTANSYANMERKVLGGFQNLMAEIGEALMPAAMKAVDVFSLAGQRIAAFFESNKEAIAENASAIMDFLAENGKAVVDLAGDLMSTLGPALKDVVKVGAELAAVLLNLGVTVIRSAVVPVIQFAARAVQGLAGAFGYLLGGLKALGVIGETTKVVESLGKAIQALPAASASPMEQVKAQFESVNKSVQKVMATIKALGNTNYAHQLQNGLMLPLLQAREAALALTGGPLASLLSGSSVSEIGRINKERNRIGDSTTSETHADTWDNPNASRERGVLKGYERARREFHGGTFGAREYAETLRSAAVDKKDPVPAAMLVEIRGIRHVIETVASPQNPNGRAGRVVATAAGPA